MVDADRNPATSCGVKNSSYTPCWKCSTLSIMLQRDGDNTVPNLEARRNGIARENRDALLEAKDRTIAELRERVALLRDELKRKEAILARMVEDIGELLPKSSSKSTNEPRMIAPGGTTMRNGNHTPNPWQDQKKPGRPTLPDGYRVVATASDAWVLVAPRGVRVAGYRGELDLRKAAFDAHEHHQRG